MIIAIDIDEVLADLMQGLIAYHNQHHGTNHTRDDFFSYDIEHVWGCTREEAITRVIAFAHRGGYKGLSPFPGVVDAVKQLSEHHTLVVVSARFDFLEEETNKWIAEHFPGMFDEVRVTNEFNPQGRARGKGEVCKELNVDLIIEDALGHALDCQGHGIKVLLFDAPWNQQETLPHGIRRVHSWEEIREEINQTTSE